MISVVVLHRYVSFYTKNCKLQSPNSIIIFVDKGLYCNMLTGE
jgi:hypothetical protein